MEPWGSISNDVEKYFQSNRLDNPREEYQAAQRKVFGVRPNQRLQAR